MLALFANQFTDISSGYDEGVHMVSAANITTPHHTPLLIHSSSSIHSFSGPGCTSSLLSTPLLSDYRAAPSTRAVPET
jgi:hypothetical protein